ncbi:MAG TPA: bifunctional [glutamine synthetase] adenylyltransferase/[glutamine synthetase]-adenylyl-L-tyrosine phosphorylase [Acidimicrobiales bacterium]|nr:bifunctional [glutamine synthetase] adenylyltransferase/[glutamine synthetase]-adenylyl-L-tyrosine phosphorylase [Acidimicrobiales bacterium]
MPAYREVLASELAASADPVQADLGLARLADAAPEPMERLRADGPLLRTVVTVMAASPFLTRTCTTDPMALDVLSALDRPVEPMEPLSRWKDLEVLRIAALDLLGETPLETVGASLADLADGLLVAATTTSCLTAELAVIAMGKLGARELNYGSDIDVVLVGGGDPQPLVNLVRQAWRTDLGLRPEGRSGPLVRSLASYVAYWDRWAQTWEFQALLKARPAAGEPGLGAAFAEQAATRVWGRPLGADDLRALRAMKARAEKAVALQGLSQREIKLGRGGIRDIEFAVQLLQLVHGRDDATLRAPATLAALEALAAGGYVARPDADGLADAYRFLRAAEHRLQLVEDRQVHALPSSTSSRAHLARVLGYRDGPSATALALFETDLARHQATARSIHERLFFRPLLEVFSAQPTEEGLGTDRLVSERLAAFGFSDATRTRAAVLELTHGFSRTSRLMHQLVPLLLDWLSESPDPDLGLLGLRRLATGPHRRAQLNSLFRESPEAARHLCLLLGTSPLYAGGYERHPDQLALLESGPPPLPDRADLERRAAEGMAWRPRSEWWRGLASLQRGELLRAQARDVLGLAELPETTRSLTRLAESVLEVALSVLSGAHAGGPTHADGVTHAEGIAVVAMGRFGGAELAYSSDLDVLLVFDDDKVSPEHAESLAEALLKLMNGETPVQRLYELDLSLRPEGRQGSLARSLNAFESYYGRWAQVWERQALTRGRFVAGDPVVGARFRELAQGFLWGAALADSEVREIRLMKARVERERVPAGEDPEFHLKLGPGSLSDVEWTVQLLQLRSGVRAEGTLDAVDALAEAGALNAGDAQVLAEAYRFCEEARNRLYLVRGRPGDSLPPPGHHLTTLARSLGMTAPELREQYRRLTRRARRVTERVFYGSD